MSSNDLIAFKQELTDSCLLHVSRVVLIKIVSHFCNILEEKDENFCVETHKIVTKKIFALVQLIVLREDQKVYFLFRNFIL